MNKISLLLLPICCILACSRDNNGPYTTLISGRYKVETISSNVAVDMNDDGIQSIDIYAEITLPYKDTGLSFFDFESSPNYLQVRPLPPEDISPAQILSLNIPDQYLLKSESGTCSLGEYLRTFIVCSYELDGNSIIIKKANPDFDENGTVNDFQRLGNGDLKLEMTKQLFDFADQQWKQANLTIIYTKVM